MNGVGANKMCGVWASSIDAAVREGIADMRFHVAKHVLKGTHISWDITKLTPPPQTKLKQPSPTKQFCRLKMVNTYTSKDLWLSPCCMGGSICRAPFDKCHPDDKFRCRATKDSKFGVTYADKV